MLQLASHLCIAHCQYLQVSSSTMSSEMQLLPHVWHELIYRWLELVWSQCCHRVFVAFRWDWCGTDHVLATYSSTAAVSQ